MLWLFAPVKLELMTGRAKYVEVVVYINAEIQRPLPNSETRPPSVNMVDNDNQVLYPLPTVSGPRSPKPFPGFSPESAEELQKWLKVDAESWHVFFDERGFHK